MIIINDTTAKQVFKRNIADENKKQSETFTKKTTIRSSLGKKN